MISDTAKKRKVAAEEYDCGSDNTAVAGVKDIIAEMKSHMMSMQNKMNDMETRAASMQNEVTLLKKENKSLKTRCGSLERSMQILVKEQKWEYSVPKIPRSHWIERGFDEEYIEEMKYHFLEKIKEATCKLRSGRAVLVGEWITVGNYDSETALLHDDLLLPHWKELRNAMHLYQKEKPLRLSINNVQLSSSVTALLMPVLKYNPIKCIELHKNSFANIREGIEFAVEVMKSNKMMEAFHWASNAIHSMEDVQYLIDAIINHPSIKEIHLEDCFGNDINGYDILRSLLTSNKNFAEIVLDNNNIRTARGGTEISDYLATNPPLKALYLQHNNLNDEDARLIARALNRNTNLKVLCLDRNNITEVGIDALSKAVYNPESLNSVADCNHTCIMYGIDFGCIPENNFQSTLLDNRSRKIYHLLSVRNREGSNVYHFNLELGDEEDDDEHLGLVPHVLESVNRYAKRRQAYYVSSPLSIMYEILQSWKMPELYERSGNN